MSSKDSIGKVVGVALCVCIACSVLVSATAVILKPIQDANKQFDKKKNILLAAGLIEEGERISKVDATKLFDDSIESVVVDLATGQLVDDTDPADIDWMKDAKTDETGRVLTDQQDIAKIGRQSNMMPVYLLKKDGQLERIVLPIYGKGLWSTMQGFLSLDADLSTIGALTFYDHGETPGLGGEIANPRWKAKWGGKMAFNDKGEPTVEVIKGAVNSDNPCAEHQVDGLSGATLTCVGVNNTIHFWLGADGYGAYLEELREGSSL